MSEEEKVSYLKMKGYAEEKYGAFSREDLRTIIKVIEREVLKNE